MDALDAAIDVFRRGGPVMWPLLLLSILSVAMSIERAWFWARTHGRDAHAWLRRASAALRYHDADKIARALRGRRLVYADVLEALSRRRPHASTAIELAESARPMIERFSAVQSVIITAAPLLGILGTVLGIIDSFRVLSSADAVRDVNAVAAGIAEALITTAAGLIVALLTLFPHALFRAQANRCLGNIERLCAAALQSRRRAHPAAIPAPIPGPSPSPAPAAPQALTPRARGRGTPAHPDTSSAPPPPDARP